MQNSILMILDNRKINYNIDTDNLIISFDFDNKTKHDWGRFVFPTNGFPGYLEGFVENFDVKKHVDNWYYRHPQSGKNTDSDELFDDVITIYDTLSELSNTLNIIKY